MWYRRDVTGRRLAQRPSCREKGTTPSSAGLSRPGRRARPKAGALWKERGRRRPCFFRLSSSRRPAHAPKPRWLVGPGQNGKRPPNDPPAQARHSQATTPAAITTTAKHAFLKVENTTSLAKLFKTAAAATDRPHHSKKGLGARERWRCRSSLTPLSSTSPRTRRRDDGGGGGAHHSPRNGRARARDQLPSSVRSCASDGDGGGGGGGGDDAPRAR